MGDQVYTGFHLCMCALDFNSVNRKITPLKNFNKKNVEMKRMLEERP